MVDPVPVSMGSSVGRDDAASTEHAEKDPTDRLYACQCQPWLLFGTLYAPAQAILFGLSFKGMIAWIVAGLPWDFVHGVSNFCCGVLIVPIVSLLRRLERK